MTEHAPERIWSSIDIPKTIAGVLAAVSAAVVGSFLGVAGTLAGAALASIVGSVGTEVYHRLVDRGHKRIKSTFVTAAAAVGTPAVAAAEDESPSEPEPVAASPRSRARWGRVALAAGAFFVLAMGALTAFELVAGKAVGTSASSKPSICSVLCGGIDQQTPAPSTTSTTPSTNDSDGQDSQDKTTAPAGGPTTEPAQPAGGTTVEPTNNAPTQGPAAENQPDVGTENADGTE